MSNSGPTNQEIEAAIDELLNPAPMTIDEALASENPAVEIGRRLGISAEQPMTAKAITERQKYWLDHLKAAETNGTRLAK